MPYTRSTYLNPDIGDNNMIVPGMDDEQKRQMISNIRNKTSALVSGDLEISKQNDDELYEQIVTAANNFVKANGFKEEQELAQTLEKANLYLYCYPYQETSQDKRDVARMAFNGYVDRPQEYQISPFLRDLKNKPQIRAQTTPDDYHLESSTVWNVFSQVTEFKNIEDKVKKALATYGVQPDDLPRLKVKDFCFLIHGQFAGKNGTAKVFEQNYKAKNTIRFITENEQEFRKGLLAMEGVREDYVEALVAAMKNGRTDLTKETDSHGKPIWKEEWSNQPVVDVHHVVNIKDAAAKEADGKSFADINAYENMCFIVRKPQHDAMHALENDMNGNYRDDVFYNRKIDKKFIYRIQPPEGVKCMLGFNNVIYDKDYLQKNNIKVEEKNEVKEAISQEKNNDKKNGNYYKNYRTNNSDKAGKLDALRKLNKNQNFKRG